ncbi:MAG: hypothetical protein ACXWLA_01640 [Myxococcaceae bacterium]
MPSSFVAVRVSLGLVLAILVAGCATSPSKSGPAPAEASSQFMAFPAVTADGKSAGTLRLGQTTLGEAKQMLPPPPADVAEGQPRIPDGYPRPTSGEVVPKPTLVYNPWKTSYQLFFDANQRLVAFVDGSSAFLGKPVAAVAKQVPDLHETVRELPFSEQQAQIGPCTTMLVMASTSDTTVSDVAYVFHCATTKAP